MQSLSVTRLQTKNENSKFTAVQLERKRDAITIIS